MRPTRRLFRNPPVEGIINVARRRAPIDLQDIPFRIVLIAVRTVVHQVPRCVVTVPAGRDLIRGRINRQQTGLGLCSKTEAAPDLPGPLFGIRPSKCGTRGELFAPMRPSNWSA